MSGNRRGQYGLILALGMVPLIGFGALSLDLAMVSSMSSQADAVAYAAAHSAIVAFKEGKTKGESQALATIMANEHASAYDGKRFQIDELEWGYVDKSNGELIPSAALTEAARARVVRENGQSVGLMLAQLFGYTTIDVHGEAVSDQIPSSFLTDGCDIEVGVNGRDGGLTTNNTNALVYSLDLGEGSVGGWYKLYKGDVAESGASQKDESSFFRVKNAVSPEGYPQPSETNCDQDFVVRDYDNGGRIPERVYIGTFWIEPGATNTLEMRHYCAHLKDVCPQYMNPQRQCGDRTNSVHFFTGDSLCAQAL